MKILVVTNFYPPHHGGTFDLRCEIVVEALRQRGHAVSVLTSNHGVGREQRGGDLERRLLLQGLAGHPTPQDYKEMLALETDNTAALRESIKAFQPDIVHVWSLEGLSKSLLFVLRQSRRPVLYDVADMWIAEGIQQDPWIAWWNRADLPWKEKLRRQTLEISGQRNKLDDLAPTRPMPGVDRLPDLYKERGDSSEACPTLASAFQFEQLYFCSRQLKMATAQAGFQVQHGDIVHPGIAAETFAGPLRAPDAPIKKLLFVGALNAKSGLQTALDALLLLRREKLPLTLSVYGRGDSDYMAQVRSYVVRSQLPVEFLTVSNATKDLAAVYRAHDILIHPDSGETHFATTPLEAMASGLPVVAADSGGIRELLRPGENAMVFNPGSVEELVGRIVELQRNPALASSLAEHAQQEALTTFHHTRMVDAIERLLEQTAVALR